MARTLPQDDQALEKIIKIRHKGSCLKSARDLHALLHTLTPVAVSSSRFDGEQLLGVLDEDEKRHIIIYSRSHGLGLGTMTEDALTVPEFVKDFRPVAADVILDPVDLQCIPAFRQVKFPMSMAVMDAGRSERLPRLALTFRQWEVFLRRAGMKTYAAQSILGEVKSDQIHAECFGLGAFMQMSFEKRVGRFKPMLGGRKMLLRVSSVIDAKWPKRVLEMSSSVSVSS